MDMITLARELGKAIQESELYKNMQTANEATENSAELQKKLSDFSDVRVKLNQEVMKADEEKSNELIG